MSNLVTKNCFVYNFKVTTTCYYLGYWQVMWKRARVTEYAVGTSVVGDGASGEAEVK